MEEIVTLPANKEVFVLATTTDSQRSQRAILLNQTDGTFIDVFVKDPHVGTPGSAQFGTKTISTGANGMTVKVIVDNRNGGDWQSSDTRLIAPNNGATYRAVEARDENPHPYDDSIVRFQWS